MLLLARTEGDADRTARCGNLGNLERMGEAGSDSNDLFSLSLNLLDIQSFKDWP